MFQVALFSIYIKGLIFIIIGQNQVDTTKIKMDVMKPWIAKRVTELLGFEDEVLINFVYGLLEAKVHSLILFTSMVQFAHAL